MKTLGIIVEYNPFHNGHLHQIRLAKKLTGADYVVVIMSGNFVQRGMPAIINKYARTAICLDNEIDLVIELPLCYACASAEYFSYGAITLLDKLGIIDYLSFGCECTDLDLLKSIADILSDEPVLFKQFLQDYLKQGIAFPLARSKSVCKYLTHEKLIESDDLEYFEKVLTSSNNILAIEYLKALKFRKSNMIPISIKRIGSDYNAEKMETTFSCATAIRKSILTNTEPLLLKNNMPSTSYNHIINSINHTCPIEENDFSSILGNAILTLTSDELLKYFDISEELANRIENNRFNYINFHQFALLLKTKDLTLTRINRALMHITLGLKKEDLTNYINNDYIYYIRILGFRKASSILLTKLKENTKLPIIVKLADANLCSTGSNMLNNNVFADHLYRLITMNKFNVTLPNEYTHGLIISS